MKRLILLTALLFSACSEERDFFVWERDPFLDQEMKTRGFTLDWENIFLYKDGVPIIEFSPTPRDCGRFCIHDNTVFLGPSEAEDAVRIAFIIAYEESRKAAEEKFLQTVGIKPRVAE